MIAVALVTIGDDLSLGAGELAWTVSSLYVAAAVGAPLCGALADYWGPRRVFLLGLGVVVGASVMGGLVDSAPGLIMSRVLLGLGAAVHYPAAMAVIRSVTAAAGRPAAPLIGVVALCGQTTAALGPLVGAALTTAVGWRGIFWVNLPVAALSCALVLTLVPGERPVRARATSGAAGGRRRVDLGGIAAFVATLTAVMVALTLLESRGPWLPWAVGATVAAVGLVLWERRHPTPFLDVRELARNRRLSGTLARAVVTYLAFYTVFYGLPQWAERSGGLTTLGSGALMVPVFVAGAVATVIASRWGSRTDPWRLLVVGSALLAAGGAVLAVGFTDGAPLAVVIVGAVLLGAPNGFNNVGNQLVLQGAVTADRAGAATGMYRTAQYVGAALSAVAVTLVLAPADADPAGAAGARGLGTLVGGVGALLLVLALTTLTTTRRRRLS
ncbi:MFS transporter [Litorihabitans aurantiacus]|uniref:MFS transporter n=2 Tax=Litorihabitans aurantiacus TaxID=1930061 RepID=A0AA37UHL9_9MICO|nr:MFS transporter [Litorihabitans aurantiacus]